MLGFLVIAGVGFGRNIVGIVIKPYETYRRIVDRSSGWELLYVAVLLAVYFAVAAVLKTASFRPFLLTSKFLLLANGVAVSYCVSVVLLWTTARLVGGKGNIRGFAIAWGYTLVPTLLWFLATSLLYILLPPPRTQHVLGIAFSVVYLVFSATLFFWKVILAYLTLRFGTRLDLKKIIIVWCVCLPLLGLYSYFMYKAGIFKVPFL